MLEKGKRNEKSKLRVRRTRLNRGTQEIITSNMNQKGSKSKKGGGATSKKK